IMVRSAWVPKVRTAPTPRTPVRRRVRARPTTIQVPPRRPRRVPRRVRARPTTTATPRARATPTATGRASPGSPRPCLTVHLRHLSITDFRSYRSAEVPLSPGITTLLGRNGQGKTNLVEAAGYAATLASHRVATDAPLVRHGAESAVVRAAVVRDGRETVVELEIVPGRANRARLNKSPLTRPRDVLGTLRTVLFAPEDLSLVKGDPSERRRFLDDLLVARQPRWAGVRSDYDKALRQRNALLRSGQHLWRPARRGVPEHRLNPGETVEEAKASAEGTLAVWDTQVAQGGAALTYARLRLLRDLGPYLSEAYTTIADTETTATVSYRSSLEGEVAETIAAGEVPDQEQLYAATLAAMEDRRRAEQERGVTLV